MSHPAKQFFHPEKRLLLQQYRAPYRYKVRQRWTSLLFYTYINCIILYNYCSIMSWKKRDASKLGKNWSGLNNFRTDFLLKWSKSRFFSRTSRSKIQVFPKVELHKSKNFSISQSGVECWRNEATKTNDHHLKISKENINPEYDVFWKQSDCSWFWYFLEKIIPK